MSHSGFYLGCHHVSCLIHNSNRIPILFQSKLSGIIVGTRFARPSIFPLPYSPFTLLTHAIGFSTLLKCNICKCLIPLIWHSARFAISIDQFVCRAVELFWTIFGIRIHYHYKTVVKWLPFNRIPSCIRTNYEEPLLQRRNYIWVIPYICRVDIRSFYVWFNKKQEWNMFTFTLSRHLFVAHCTLWYILKGCAGCEFVLGFTVWCSWYALFH